jgi:hypothetical protein
MGRRPITDHRSPTSDTHKRWISGDKRCLACLAVVLKDGTKEDGAEEVQNIFLPLKNAKLALKLIFRIPTRSKTCSIRLIFLLLIFQYRLCMKSQRRPSVDATILSRHFEHSPAHRVPRQDCRSYSASTLF